MKKDILTCSVICFVFAVVCAIVYYKYLKPDPQQLYDPKNEKVILGNVINLMEAQSSYFSITSRKTHYAKSISELKNWVRGNLITGDPEYEYFIKTNNSSEKYLPFVIIAKPKSDDRYCIYIVQVDDDTGYITNIRQVSKWYRVKNKDFVEKIATAVDSDADFSKLMEKIKNDKTTEEIIY